MFFKIILNNTSLFLFISLIGETHMSPHKTNYKEIRLIETKNKLATKIKKNTQITIAPDNILAFELETNSVLFYKRTDNKGRRNRAIFYTLNIKTGVQLELFHNPLAIQEINSHGILF